MPELPAEIQLIAACARRAMCTRDLDRARAAIQRGVKWDRVFDYARVHRLVPLLARHAGDAGFPAESCARLRRRAEEIARRNLQLTAALCEMLDALASSGVRVMPLKGPMLAEQVYGSLGLRQFDDLDLLVSSEDVARASDALRACGYERRSRAPEHLRGLEETTAHHISLVSRARRLHVELHNALISTSSGRRYELDGLPSESVHFCGRQVPALPPDALIAYLCQHGATHAWSRLEWLATVAELMRQRGIEGALQEAARWQGRRRVLAAAMLAHAVFDGEADRPPAGVPRAVRRATGQVIARLGREPDRVMATAPERFVFQAGTDEGWWARARRTAALLTPTADDLERVPLPRAAWPVYRVLRPAHLAWRLVGRGTGSSDRDRSHSGH